MIKASNLFQSAAVLLAGLAAVSCQHSPTGISIISGTQELKIKESLTLELEIVPADATYEDVITWKTSDASIAKIDEEGTVTGIKVGQVEVTATLGMLTSTYRLSVVPQYASTLIKAGTFNMGTEGGGKWGDESLHEVTLTKDYCMTTYEITNAQFVEFLNDMKIPENGKYETAEFGEQPLLIPHAIGATYKDGKWEHKEDKGNFPAVSITWYGANEFALWAGGQLPSEAQWEYACRAGTQTAYYFGDDASQIGDYAWFKDNANNTTHEIGTKEPNAWGLYDMLGNAYEWVYDCWDGSDYPKDPATDPVSPTPGEKRIIRGGSWFNSANDCSCTMRNYYNPPSSTTHSNGFRIIYQLN